MFSWLVSIGNFFKKLFGVNGPVIQEVLHDVSSIVSFATPVVAQLDAIASTQSNPSDLIKFIRVWIAKYKLAAPVVDEWAQAAQPLSVADILRSAAALIVSNFVPAGTARSLINLAIELAYNAFKKTKAA